MTVTITLPEEIESRLQRKAQSQHQSVEELALEILGYVLEMEEPFPSPKAVVAKLKTTPPDIHYIRPASGSLAEALRHAATDPDFNLATWKEEWAAVEAEMQALTEANAIAEGRR